jgi:type II secretory pathway component GspD/PulD (secretin)
MAMIGRICVRTLAGGALAATLLGNCMTAQAQEGESQKAVEKAAPETNETIFLAHAAGQNDLNDVQTALRNNFPRSRMYGNFEQYAITVRATAEDMAGIKRMVAELDRPKKVYRVTYNISNVENGKRTETQHYSLIVAAGARSTLKQGKRVPLVTGMSGDGANDANRSQVQYIDVGVTIEAIVEGQGLHTKVELSGMTDEKSGIGAQDPVVQQTLLEGTSNLTPGKPMLLGSVEVPGTSQQKEIEVSTELLTQ